MTEEYKPYHPFISGGRVHDELLETYSTGYWCTQGLQSMAQELIERRKKDKTMTATLKDLERARIGVELRYSIIEESYIYMPGGTNGWVYLWPKDNCWHDAAVDEDGHMAAYFSVDKAVEYLAKLKKELESCGTAVESTTGS